jgi:hypothetical protein
MKIMKRTILLLTLIAVIIGCSTKKKTLSDRYITCLKPIPERPQQLSGMMKSIKFIPLETTNQSLIGKWINKIKKINNKYYVAYDRKELLEFDENGAFVKKIGHLGSGPGEYVELNDFDVFENGSIVINDAQQLMFYDKDGKYQHTVMLQVMPWKMKLVKDDRILVFGSGTEYVIYEIDLSGKIIKKEFKMNNATKSGKYIHFINYGQDKTITQIGYSNEFIVYDFNDKNFSYTKLLCDDDILSSISEEKLWQATSDFRNVYKNIQDKAIFRAAGSNSHFFFWYGYENDIKSQILNIETGNIEHVISNKDIDDITFVEPSGFILGGTITTDTQDCFITYVYLEDVRKGLDKYSEFADNLNYKKLDELLRGKNEEEIADENPMLVEFIFK